MNTNEYKRIMLFFIFLFTVVQLTKSFGKLGHEFIGNQIYQQLSQHTIDKIHQCGYLDNFPGGFAELSVWADTIRQKIRYTAPMHYYSIKSFPPLQCIKVFDEYQDDLPVHYTNIFKALYEFSFRLKYRKCDLFAFSMLVHLLQDLHQPLHLTGRDLGGNRNFIVLQGKRMSLHHIWDTFLVKMYLSKNVTKSTLNCDYLNNGNDELKNIINDIHRFNCGIVWTITDDTLQESLETLHQLLTRAIERSVCFLENLLK